MEFLPKRNEARIRLVSVMIAVMFVVDISLLITTFLISDDVKEKAIVINLSGRQRMLSQRMVKCLLMLRQEERPSADMPLQEELANTFRLFDTTLSGLQQGGTVENGHGVTIQVAALRNDTAQQLMGEAQSIWQPYRTKVASVLLDPTSAEKIAIAAEMGIERNRQLLDLMNRLTTHLEDSAIRQTAELHTLQSLMMGTAIFSFCIMLIMMRHELKRTNKSRDALNKIIHTISSGILVINDHGIILGANYAAAAIFGYDKQEMLEGKAHHHLLFRRGNELFGRRQDGSIFPASAHASEVQFDDTQLKLETVADITLQRSVEESLSQLAYYDALTGLPNRLLFEDRLHQGMIAAKRQGTRLAVLFVDLNKFKQVNDTHGHHIGDLLLKGIADRLQGNLREEDTVSRLGGDEFVVMLSALANREDCEQIILKLLHILRAPLVAESIVLQPDASIGICLYPDHGEDEKSIVKLADHAMYRAKRDAERHFAFYGDDAIDSGDDKTPVTNTSLPDTVTE